MRKHELRRYPPAEHQGGRQLAAAAEARPARHIFCCSSWAPALSSTGATRSRHSTKSQDEEVKLREAYATKKAKAVNLELYVQQLKEIEQSFGALLKQLPNKSEMDALLTDINQAGLGRGLQFELFKPGVAGKNG